MWIVDCGGSLGGVVEVFLNLFAKIFDCFTGVLADFFGVLFEVFGGVADFLVIAGIEGIAHFVTHFLADGGFLFPAGGEGEYGGGSG